MDESFELFNLFSDDETMKVNEFDSSVVLNKQKNIDTSSRKVRHSASVGSIQSLLQLKKRSNADSANECLPPEMEEGNVEYKRQLLNLTEDRFEHLVTQLNWRLAEGEGEAIYELGVEDNGRIGGLDYPQLEESLQTLRRMAERLGAQVTILRERHVSASENIFESSRRLSNVSEIHLKRSLEVLIKKQPLEIMTTEIRLVLLGNMDAGKSTMVGVLSQGELDNGRGRARLNLFRHPHEILSGRTSCISSEHLLFNDKGEPINPRLINQQHHSYSIPSNICRDLSAPVASDYIPSVSPVAANNMTKHYWWNQANKIVTLIDLAGHKKYQRTTLYGLTSRLPHCAMLVISAVTGFIKCCQSHFYHALALKLPLVVVINKCDLATADVALQQLQRWLTVLHDDFSKSLPLGCPAFVFLVKTFEDAEKASKNLMINHSPSILPVFCVSCVTGLGLNLLNHFLGKITLELDVMSSSAIAGDDSAVVFSVSQVHNLPSVRGLVLLGLLESGRIEAGQCLYLGPYQSGCFQKVTVDSVHKNRFAQRFVSAGETASIAIRSSTTDTQDCDSLSARRGMVLLQLPPQQNTHSQSAGATWEFEGVLSTLFVVDGIKTVSPFIQPNLLLKNKQWNIYCSGICQSVIMLSIDNSPHSHDSQPPQTLTKVRFRFVKRPEYLQLNKSFIYRSGPSQGHGTILQIFPIHDDKTI